MQRNEVKLEKFNSEDYYTVENENRVRDIQYRSAISITFEGIKLIAAYYNNKYQTNISCPTDISPEELDKLSMRDKVWHYSTDGEFARDGINILEKLREEKPNEYRAAFIVGHVSHKTPIVYFRENNEEGILYANTLSNLKKFMLLPLAQLSKRAEINIYIVETSRQGSDYGCGVDALVFARDATAMDKEKRQYKIPGLLAQLKSRAINKSGQYYVLLPNEFLKTAQLTEFINLNQESDVKKVIHKNETLAEFRKRYTYENVRMTDDRIKAISSYTREKGFKYADLIEIQFYINELRSIVRNHWDDKIGNDFLVQAKKVLQKQGKVTKEHARDGLHEYASEFLANLLQPDQKPQTPLLVGNHATLYGSTMNANLPPPPAAEPQEKGCCLCM